ncbi:MAG: hypothetical protein ACI8QD_001796 [Cyclobacteriaceae bacterium]|jgi:hypothetical protein
MAHQDYFQKYELCTIYKIHLVRSVRIIIRIICLLSLTSNLAQDGAFHAGAASSSMAETNVNISDHWSVFNNPAGMATLHEPGMLLGYRSQYGMAAFQVLSMAFIYPALNFTSAVSFLRFGDDIYNQQKIGFHLAHKLQMVSLGIGVQYVQHHFNELGTLGGIAIDFGGIAEITEYLRLGAHIFNINQGALNVRQPIPVIMRVGISYLPSERFIITTELENDLDRSEVLKIGLSYQLVEWLDLRTGFANSPKSLCFGFGLRHDKLIADYAYITRAPAGIIHEFSFTIFPAK